MKTDSPLIRIGLAVYLVMFFTYLLGPLVLMSITAFNSAQFPQVTPWEVLSFEWFGVLFNDERILNGLRNSFIVGFFTVILSVAIGLAGALMLTQIWPKIRATYYTIIIAPILIPGVVLGISTLVFWDRINVMLGLSGDSFLHNGIFLTVLGHSTFISSYCMLVFVARLQRYDTGLTEAALDLGATHVQAFRKIQLPFLYPAIGSAAVLAFLASFENYNTTTFTFQKYPTLTIELAQKVRYGINPSISALAFIIVCLTVFFALVHEVRTRRAQLAIANGAPVGAGQGWVRNAEILLAQSGRRGPDPVRSVGRHDARLLAVLRSRTGQGSVAETEARRTGNRHQAAAGRAPHEAPAEVLQRAGYFRIRQFQDPAAAEQDRLWRCL